MMAPLLARIIETAERHPDRLALACWDGTFSYRELLHSAQHVANTLLESATSLERVGLVAGDDRMTYAALLGIWLAGGAYTPLSTANPRLRNQEIITDARLDVVLSSHDHEPARLAAETAQAGWALMPSPDELDGNPLVAGARARTDLAYILFTSGTTGRPKGVPITHANLQGFADAWLTDAPYRMGADDRFLQMFKLGFDLSVMNIFIPWALGASTHVVPHKGIAYLNIYGTLADSGITVAMMVPSVLSYLSRFFDEIDLPDLRYSLFCGEALPHSLTARWSRCVPSALIQNTYGPTEATIFCYTYLWDRARSAAEAVNDVVAIGQPIPGMGGMVLNESGDEAAVEEVGELCLYGRQLAPGYWGDAGKSGTAFFSREVGGVATTLYHTGDLAARLASGVTVWRGRKDHQVKIDGHRIELGEIEAHARTLSGSPAAAAIAMRCEGGHVKLVLFIEGGGFPAADLSAQLAGRLPEYMRPAEIVQLDALPLNRNGKIDRNKLAVLLRAE